MVRDAIDTYLEKGERGSDANGWTPKRSKHRTPQRRNGTIQPRKKCFYDESYENPINTSRTTAFYHLSYRHEIQQPHPQVWLGFVGHEWTGWRRHLDCRRLPVRVGQGAN